MKSSNLKGKKKEIFIKIENFYEELIVFFRQKKDKINEECLKTILKKEESFFLELESNTQFKQLIYEFGLNRQQTHIIALCFYVNLDLNNKNKIIYLQDKAEISTLSIDIIIKLLNVIFIDKIDLYKEFYKSSLLIKNKLIEIVSRGDENSELSFSVKLNCNISMFLKNIRLLNNDLVEFAKFSNLKDLSIMEQEESKSTSFEELEINGKLYYLYGIEKVSKKNFIEQLCKKSQFNLLEIDSLLFLEHFSLNQNIMKEILNEVRLKKAIIYFKNFNFFYEFLARENSSALSFFFNFLNRNKDLLCLCLDFEKLVHFYDLSNQFHVIEKEFSLNSYKSRILIWENCLKKKFLNYKKEEIQSLASQFKLTEEQIILITQLTFNKCYKNSEKNSIDINDFYPFCRKITHVNMESLSQKITSKHTLEDIILEKDQKNQLKEIILQFKNREKIYYEWGFDEKISLGKGMNILFFGPSGTGKTMSAEIIAHELELDLYKIDLSNIISKYIGETEKNLSKIFNEAKSSNAILFFDEADAIFGKRSQVKDAQDRYANIETGYLLQKMEEYEGIIILATNLRKNMDNAFIRRIHFAVEFDLPKKEQRLEIWKNIFPQKAPLSKDIDFNFLAENIKIAGGNIKNIALNAAFLASENKNQITMKDIILAIRREYQKIGRMCIKSDFGKYYSIINSTEIL